MLDRLGFLKLPKSGLPKLGAPFRIVRLELPGQAILLLIRCCVPVTEEFLNVPFALLNLFPTECFQFLEHGRPREALASIAP